VNKHYYTYILIDSQNKKPFYVGKGSGSRMYSHIKEATRDSYKKKRSLHCKIVSILNNGGSIIYKKIAAESEKAAFDKEKELIIEYGRKDIGTGILCNLTEGGEGSSNTNPESIRRRAEKHRGMKRSDEARKNMKEAQLKSVANRLAKTGLKRSLESCTKQSKSTKGKSWSEKARNIKRHKPTAISVVAYNKKTNEFVGSWNSISECASELNCDVSSIWKILNGWVSKAPDGTMRPYKSHRGYFFKRAD